MINLAGATDVDEVIKDELIRAGIEIVSVPLSKGEIRYTFEGLLKVKNIIINNSISFRRAWYYWVARGNVPLALAQKLYTHPEGRKTVRVGGDCGCPAPEKQIVWISDDNKILNDWSELKKYPDDSIFWKGINKEIMESNDGRYRFVADRTKAGNPYISTYHIDTQAGLLLFAETLKGNLK